MAVKNKAERRKVLKRQKLLYEIHCKNCVNKNTKSNTFCHGCAILDEFLKIGKVLDGTITERKEVS